MEWVKKVSFARLNKLFEISTSERDHQVLILDNNLQALVNNLQEGMGTLLLGFPVPGSQQALLVEGPTFL